MTVPVGDENAMLAAAICRSRLRSCLALSLDVPVGNPNIYGLSGPYSPKISVIRIGYGESRAAWCAAAYDELRRCLQRTSSLPDP